MRNINLPVISSVLGYSPNELSKDLKISIPSLARDRAKGCLGGIPFVKLGRKVIYPKDSVIKWMMVREQRGANTPVQSNHVRGRPIGSTKAVAAARRHQKSVDNELML